MRSFLGLANQLGHFIPDLAQASAQMRGLLKKGIAFQWLPEHEREFRTLKGMLTSPLIVYFFDPKLDTMLLTDASKLYGLGYALVQKDSAGKLRLIQAGSRSLAPAEKNYAPIESECLAAVWAMAKCRHFLFGCQSFDLITDHQPLIGIFRKDIIDIDNRRLQRLREKVLDYCFKVIWVEGKSHLIADALSRNPVGGPETSALGHAICSVLYSVDPNLERVKIAADTCPIYQQVLKGVTELTCSDVKRLPRDDPCLAYRHVWQDLSVHDDERLLLYKADKIVIPRSARPKLLETLHAGHPGIVRMSKLAKQFYFWPGMRNDITQFVTGCNSCFELLPQQRAMPLTQTEGTYPFEHTSADLFSYGGKDYLAFADRFSGMLWCSRLSTTSTAAVTRILDNWFNDFGVPLYIRTDGGPQFRGLFDEWCKALGLIHQLSSAYNPQSNGHAEAAVKQAKYLLQKCDANMRQFAQHLFAWRTTPRGNYFLSPSELFFGRRLRRADLPTLSPPSCGQVDYSAALDAQRKHSAKVKSAYDASAVPLPPLLEGDVAVARNQDPARKQWNTEVTIVRPRRPDNLSYEVRKEDGAVSTRTRQQLKPKPKLLLQRQPEPEPPLPIQPEPLLLPQPATEVVPSRAEPTKVLPGRAEPTKVLPGVLPGRAGPTKALPTQPETKAMLLTQPETETEAKPLAPVGKKKTVHFNLNTKKK